MKTITGNQLRTNLEAKKVLAVAIDPKENFNKEHIAGTINIPFDDKQFSQKVAKNVSNKEKPIALCAQNGYSRELKNCAKKLEESGHSQVSVYQGGMEDWKSSRLEYDQNR